MQGEFKGDFTRDTFDPDKNYTRVLMQQGRVLLDQDWNEQVAITLDYLRSLAKGIFGDHGGPDENAFKVTRKNVASSREYNIGKGQYYVEGWLCNNTSDTTLTINTQNGSSILVYLDVWERHVTYLDDKAIREVALGGPDTTSRAKLVSVVKYVDCGANDNKLALNYKTVIEKIDPNKPTKGKLAARARRENADDEPCSISPEAKYRGSENHLYRVEIHESGSPGTATFKWSRDNGSVVFPILSSDGNRVTLTHLGRDSATSLEVNDWVEILEDSMIHNGQPGILVQVVSIDPVEMVVTVRSDSPSSDSLGNATLLRRWDHQKIVNATRGDIPIPILNTDNKSGWIPLEYGIEIEFKSDSNEPYFKAGDYWLIPARTATGDIEWPNDSFKMPQGIEPHGIKRYYAPLAEVKAGGSPIDLRNVRLAYNKKLTSEEQVTFSSFITKRFFRTPGSKDYMLSVVPSNTDSQIFWQKGMESNKEVTYTFSPTSDGNSLGMLLQFYEIF